MYGNERIAVKYKLLLSILQLFVFLFVKINSATK